MSNIKDTKREELIDQCESLYIQGFRKPYQIQKLLGISDTRTAFKYLNVASRRAHRRNRNINKERLFKEQLNILDLMIHESWKMYLEASSVNEKVGALNTVGKILKQRTELLGLEAPTEIRVATDRGETLYETLQKMPREQADAVIEQLQILETYRGKPVPSHNFQTQTN